ncbi:hypothetical protein ACOV3F_004724, partial [Escherichia coli]
LTGNGTRPTFSALMTFCFLLVNLDVLLRAVGHAVQVLFLLGSDGSEIHIQWASGTPGLGLLVLPLSVTGDTQTAGVLAAELQAFGALAWAENNGFGARITQIHFFLF